MNKECYKLPGRRNMLLSIQKEIKLSQMCSHTVIYQEITESGETKVCGQGAKEPIPVKLSLIYMKRRESPL